MHTHVSSEACVLMYAQCTLLCSPTFGSQGTFAVAGVECQSCAGGHYSARGATKCDLCKWRLFGLLSVQTPLLPPPSVPMVAGLPGVLLTATGPAGTNSSGSSSCSRCPAGYFSGAGMTLCLPCPAGFMSLEGASECKECSAGTVSNATAARCTRCPDGMFSYPGSSECIGCAVAA